MTVRAVLEERGAKRVTFIRRGEEPASDDDLIVNATPVGMFPDVDSVRVNISRYIACKAVLDLVYNPSPTRLVREARACGKTAADGLVMLIAQAWRAFQLATANSQRPTANSSLFLYGPPASGKSTLAAKIAAATGWTLVDLDAQIVKAEGRTIPEIFAVDGELGFRAIEKRELRRVAAGKGQVVALGGGALLNPECRAIAEQAGRVIVLDCPLETLKARLTGGDRPLSADTAKLEALVASRAAHYASFPSHINLL
jgi:shikimate dehydrogenase